jgi:hypothetical protein
MRSPEPPGGGGAVQAGRASLSILLLITGLVVLTIGTLCLFVKRNILDPDRLAAHAVATLNENEIKDFVAQKTANAAIAQAPDLADSREEIQNATKAVTGSDAFETVVTKAIVTANHALLDNGNDDTIMQLQNLGSVVRNQLAESNPELAARIPDDLDAQIADLGRSHGLTNVLQAIEKIKFLGLILPPIALALLIASIFAGADRMAALMRLGIGLMIWGAASFVVLLLAKPAAVNRAPEGIQRDAASAAWDEIVGALGTWYVITAVIGIALAAVAFYAGRREGSAAPA